MTVTLTFEEKSNLTPEERKKFFRERLLERIREQIGTDNVDQALKEQVLMNVCAKITSVYVGCFDAVEQSLGEAIWAYKMEPERFYNMTKQEQERYKVMSLLWTDCKDVIRSIGSNVIEDVIYALSWVDFSKPKNYTNLMAQKKERERKRLEQLQGKDNEDERNERSE